MVSWPDILVTSREIGVAKNVEILTQLSVRAWKGFDLLKIKVMTHTIECISLEGRSIVFEDEGPDSHSTKVYELGES